MPAHWQPPLAVLHLVGHAHTPAQGMQKKDRLITQFLAVFHPAGHAHAPAQGMQKSVQLFTQDASIGWRLRCCT